MIGNDLFVGAAALTALIFPGWWISRARSLPLPLVAGFIFGAVGLTAVVQLLDALNLGLLVETTATAWLIICLGAVLFCRTRGLKKIELHLPWRTEWLLMLPVIPAIAVVVYRAVIQPLSGVDTIFRWNFLAEQMFARGTLAFYPPVLASDYEIYAWPDGIAPIVSVLYFWGYALAGAVRPVVTAPLVIAQFLSLLAVTHAFTKQLATTRAATIACALVACSPIVLWSTAMGQETGLIAIATIALLFYFPVSRETATPLPAVMAGLAAALGGLAREYGLSLILFGAVLGIIRRLPARILGFFVLTALAGTLPWYVRNWLHTGNPLFNLDVGGLFPVNSAQLRLMRVYQETFGWGHLGAAPEVLRIFVTNCMSALVAGMTGAALYFKRTQCCLAALVMMIALWAVSLGYTAAGFIYSLRVLTPALVIAAVIGGMALARWVPSRQHLTGVALALTAFACDSALRTLALPGNVYKIPPAEWLAVGGAVQQYHQRPIYRQLADYAANRRILVLGPAALLNQNGARTVPFWSPELKYLWSESCTPTEAARRLVASGISFVLINKGEINQKYITQIPVFGRSLNPLLQQIWEDSDMVLFRVVAPMTSAVPDRP